jgi:hypothetical protein
VRLHPFTGCYLWDNVQLVLGTCQDMVFERKPTGLLDILGQLNKHKDEEPGEYLAKDWTHMSEFLREMALCIVALCCLGPSQTTTLPETPRSARRGRRWLER